MESLRIGGAEKSLITLLSLLDKEKYDIDLFLFRHSGDFMNQIPDNVHLLPEDTNIVTMSDHKKAFAKFLCKGDFLRAFHSFCWLLECFISKYILKHQEYCGWSHLKRIYSHIEKEYDVSIGYLEKKSTYFSIEHVKAKKHIAFMHTDYDAIPHDEHLDRQYFKHLYALAVVSDHLAEVMKKHFPFMSDRIHIVKNQISPGIIRKMSLDPAPELEGYDCNTIKIVTVGRLTPQKNIDGAILICKQLRNLNLPIKWFVIGEGEQREELEVIIKENGLENDFYLLGSRSNPYPYMEKCDIYVQPSRWEGYGITVAEAKCLCKPIIASDIPEFREQIDDEINGLIAIDEKDMVTKINELINNNQNRIQLIRELNKEVNNITLNDLREFEELLSK